MKEYLKKHKDTIAGLIILIILILAILFVKQKNCEHSWHRDNDYCLEETKETYQDNNTNTLLEVYANGDHKVYFTWQEYDWILTFNKSNDYIKWETQEGQEEDVIVYMYINSYGTDGYGESWLYYSYEDNIKVLVSKNEDSIRFEVDSKTMRFNYRIE